MPKTSKNDAEEFIKEQTTYGFKNVTFYLPDLSDISVPGESGGIAVLKKYQDEYAAKIYVQPKFTETIFGSNNAVGILSLGFLIFLLILLIILAVLYRTTGIFSWLCLMFALSMTLLISTISAITISLSLVFGLFALALVGSLICLGICEKIKRRLRSNEDTHLMVKKTFKSSLLPVCDLSLISLIFGICITYIAPIAMNMLGVSLIVGSFAYLLEISFHKAIQ